MIDCERLLDYHYWATARLLDALEPMTSEAFLADRGSSFRSIRDTVIHMYSAEWTWHSRWRGHSPSSHISPEAFPDAVTIRSAWSELESQVREFVGTLDGHRRARVFDYFAFNGQAQRSVFWHMLQHVVNHASYHRGQVTTMLRQSGAAPPKSMDMIAFYRERGD